MSDEFDIDDLDEIISDNKSKQIEQLVNDLTIGSKAYYTNGTSPFTDAQWDEMYYKLKELDPENSLLNEVGHGYSVEDEEVDEKEKVEHLIPVGSIPKIKNIEELKKKIDKYTTFSVKLDGNSIVAYYVNGVLDVVVTRGKNNIGINRTNKFKKILPNKIDVPGLVAVRGEAVISKENYSTSNGFDIEVSSRNVVAGLIAKKEDWEEKFKFVEFIAYTFINIKTKKSIYKDYEWSKWFSVEEQKNIKIFMESDITDFYDTYKLNWKYDADGTVFLFKDGSMLALKYEDESAHTSIEDIPTTIGVDQRLTPIAILKPVKLAGATLSKASLGSFGRVLELGLWPIPRVVKVSVIRANEIIPYVSKVEYKSNEVRDCGEFPLCPVCGTESKLIGKHVYCVNPNCSNIETSALLKFSSYFYPDGLSDKQIEKVFNHYNIKNIVDLLKFEYKKTRFTRIDGIGKSLSNLLEVFFYNLSQPIDSVIVYNSVVIGCGKTLAMNIIKQGIDIHNVCEDQSLINQIKFISGFPSKVADDIWNKRDIIKKICELRNVVDNKPNKIIGTFAQSQIRFSKDQIERLKQIGWMEDSSVKKTTTVLVTIDPDADSTKIVKARKINVPVVDVETFWSKYVEEGNDE